MIIENLDDIEMYLEVKFGDMKDDEFFHKATNRGCDDEDYIIDFTGMIERLAEVVEQHLADEDFTFDAVMPEISESQWEDWLSEYYVPDRDVCSCSNGCKTCLMTEW